MIKAGLDFGNSKISCVVADYKNSTNIDILSLASIPSTNIKKSVENKGSLYFFDLYLLSFLF